VSWGSDGKSWLLVNIDIDGDFSDLLVSPVEFNCVGGNTSTNSLKHDYFLLVAWLGSEWHVVIKTWEKDIVVKVFFVTLPFLPGTAVLSTGDKNDISSLYKDALVLELLNLTSVV